MKRQWLCAVGCVLCVALLTGCESLRRKFVRKPKKPQRIVSLSTTQSYAIHRTPLESYEHHYLQWTFWNAELLAGLEGINRLKVARAAQESAAELRKLAELLREPTAQALQPLIAENDACAKQVQATKSLSLSEAGTWRTRIERQQRLMHREFLAKKVSGALKPEGAAGP